VGVVPLPTPLSGQSAVYLTLGEDTPGSRGVVPLSTPMTGRSAVYLNQGEVTKRLVFVFLCRALIMNIFRKYNMRV